MTQEQIAALLVARRWADRPARRDDNAWRSIKLASLNQCSCARDCRRGRGFIYVLEDGAILSGHSRREARPVGPQTRERMLGEDDDG